MDFTIEYLTKLLGKNDLYFTLEQIMYLSKKLGNPEYHSLYLHSVMSNDMKKIKCK